MDTAKCLALPVPAETTFCDTRIVSNKRYFEDERYSESVDEPVSDPQTKFNVEFFYRVVNVCLTALDSRFEQLPSVLQPFNFLFNIAATKALSDNDLRKG